MLKYINISLSVFLLICSAAPLIFGIFSAGSLILLSFALFFMFLSPFLGFLSAYPRLKILFITLSCLFFGACIIISIFMAIKAWFDRPPVSGKTTVIVLGAGISGDRPSLMLRRRLDAAAEYLKQNPEANCIVTGGQGPDEDYPEAFVMAKYLYETGIEENRVLLEDKSVNTKQNFRFAAKLLEADTPVIIVTDSYHQARASIYAKTECRRAGITEYYSISSLTPWGLMPVYWARDMMGIPIAILQGIASRML